MKNSQDYTAILPAADFFAKIDHKTIFLDTSVFIDATISYNAFVKFFSKCADSKAVFVTTDQVKMEFLRGAENVQKYEERSLLIDSIIYQFFPVNPAVCNNLIFDLIKLYRETGKGVSITDLALGAMIQKHWKDALLLTRNPTDFPSDIFTLESSIIVQKRRALLVYGLFSYTPPLKSVTEIPF